MATIKVDFDRCQSNGVCESMAPEHFEVDEQGYLQVLKEDVTEGERAAVEDAVAGCPTEALRLAE